MKKSEILEALIGTLRGDNERLREELSDIQTAAMIRSERADDRRDAVLKKLLPLAPVLLSRLLAAMTAMTATPRAATREAAGTAAAAARDDADVLLALVRGFIESLGDERAKFFSVLSMEQKILFLEIAQVAQVAQVEHRATTEPDVVASGDHGAGTAPTDAASGDQASQG